MIVKQEWHVNWQSVLQINWFNHQYNLRHLNQEVIWPPDLFHIPEWHISLRLPTKIHQSKHPLPEICLKLLRWIIILDIISKLDKSPTVNPNVNYKKLHDLIDNAKNKHLPPKMVRFNQYRHKMAKWIMGGLITSIKYRDNLYKKLKLNDPNSLEHASVETHFKVYNVILKKLLEFLRGSMFSQI